jgi:hypothetical protein
MPGSATGPDSAAGSAAPLRPAAPRPAAPHPAAPSHPVAPPRPAPRPGVAAWVYARLGPTFRPYAVAWLYLAAFCAAGIVYQLLPGGGQAAVLGWASTNVHNLTHDPVGCLIASAFFAAGGLSIWPAIIALTMFGANGALGNWRLAVTCAAGNIIGSLVSEGILWYQIAHGTMPASDRYIQDVGPSYVVVAAIAVALIWGSWLARCTAAAVFAGLIFAGHIFSGLTHLTVTPVGHATAFFVGATLGSFLAWQRRRGPGRRAPGCASRRAPAGGGGPT